MRPAAGAFTGAGASMGAATAMGAGAALAGGPSAGEPAFDPAELYGIIPPSSRKPYDVRELIARLVDRSWFDEF
jgi:hypothetical protein